jgi:hypothetical protein
MYKNSDPTFLKRESISNAKKEHLILFRYTIGICFENQLEYTNTLRGWIQSYWTLNVNGHWDEKDLILKATVQGYCSKNNIDLIQAALDSRLDRVVG